ncbi:MAG TPA: hypothetical protein GX702_14880 [Chloroflexi bacterium]|jgi:hypothetical protein|nr:hypothetical protein [Chloroflexota bacterium]
MSFPPIPTQVRCPQCGTTFVVQTRTVIDAGKEPELKTALLRGEINLARCPNCGAGGLLGSPILYHDPEKELLIAFVPSEMGLPADQEEQIVGSLVQAVMNSIPAEQRKGYFLQPRRVLTLEGLYDSILEADGVSRETLDAHRARVRLLNQMLSAVDDDETLATLVEENRDTLTYEFFLFLSNLIEGPEEEEAPTDEENNLASQLRVLRDKLLEHIGPITSPMPSGDASDDEFIDMLRSIEGEENWTRAIALNRPRLNYGFFQALTNRIEQAESEGNNETAQALTELRQRILQELDAQDQFLRQAQQKAEQLVEQIVEAEDVAAAVREHMEQIDPMFLSVLVRYRETAQGEGDEERVAKMDAILEAVTEALEENLPPDVRLINRLLRTDYPDGTNAVLEAHRGMLTDEFLQTFDEHMKRFEESADQEVMEHLRGVRQQIVLKRTILRG